MPSPADTADEGDLRGGAGLSDDLEGQAAFIGLKSCNHLTTYMMAARHERWTDDQRSTVDR